MGHNLQDPSATVESRILLIMCQVEEDGMEEDLDILEEEEEDRVTVALAQEDIQELFRVEPPVPLAQEPSSSINKAYQLLQDQ